MENDLLESCKKLLTKGYTGIVVSDSNGLPVFGTSPIALEPWRDAGRIFTVDIIQNFAVKGACVSNSLGASGFSSSLVCERFRLCFWSLHHSLSANLALVPARCRPR